MTQSNSQEQSSWRKLLTANKGNDRLFIVGLSARKTKGPKGKKNESSSIVASEEGEPKFNLDVSDHPFILVPYDTSRISKDQSQSVPAETRIVVKPLQNILTETFLPS